MNYRKDLKSGNMLSVLGFGCMRFPRGASVRIDIEKSEKLVLTAIEKGVNYFDTGYVYAGSEQALGEILRRNNGVREKIYIATKLPHGKCKTYEDFDRFFNIQLERLNTDYIDYYLMHNLTSVADWDKIRRLGIEDWIAQKKASGKIKQIGFSFHGIQSGFLALLDEYDWDFCMIQYNYMNENYQAGKKGLLRAYEKGLTVIVMEPLLGGKLATGLPKKAARLFRENGDISPAAWATRWLWNHKEISVVLSGMSTREALEDNIKTACSAEENMLGEGELNVTEKARDIIKESFKIPCTGCNYCLPCPKGVNIPDIFTAYNAFYSSGLVTGMQLYVTSTGSTNPKRNSGGRNCTSCGACEKLCPQNIEIMKSLKKATRRMEPFWFKTAIKIINKIMS